MTKKNISECYTIGVEMNQTGDMSVFVVVKRDGDISKVVNTYTGKEAEKKYKKFIKDFCTPPNESRQTHPIL